MSDTGFTGAIPELYDRLMGPMLFEPFGRDIARRFAGFEGAILETAAGTGQVTRLLAEAVGAGATIIATDLNPPMLARAAEVVSDGRVRWRQADAQALPFDDASFDAVICQFGVMFYPDKGLGYREAHRVLRPGGRYVFNVWDALEANGVSHTLHKSLAAVFPDDPPDFYARIPFGYHDSAAIGAAVMAAGFDAVAVDTVRLPTPGRSALEVATALCLGSPLRTELEARAPDRLDEVVDIARRAIEDAYGAGPINAHGQALVFTATA